jgi:hypothetical protein
MTKNAHKPVTKNNEFMVSVARSIGSTLGALAAKVSRSPRTPRRPAARRKRARK